MCHENEEGLVGMVPSAVSADAVELARPRSYDRLRAARREKSEAWEHADYLVDKALDAYHAANLEASRARDRVEEAKANRARALQEYSFARREAEKFREELAKSRGEE
jgi:hypothetical protein